MFLIRLDDACPYMDTEKWDRAEKLLDKYGVKPIVAVIPDCHDKMFTGAYSPDNSFWEKARGWQDKGWTVALHGYDHVYTNMHARGVNPVNSFSEFVGLPLERQKEKIKAGTAILRSHGLEPKCFVAPAHSFDENTVAAVKSETDMRVICDTVAADVYYKDGIFYIPQQCGSFRNIRLKTVTFCYHPNTMSDEQFLRLDAALSRHSAEFISADRLEYKKRSFGFADRVMRSMYFLRKRLGR